MEMGRLMLDILALDQEVHIHQPAMAAAGYSAR